MCIKTITWLGKTVGNVRFNRSSPPEVFCKKGVLRNFTKFTGKHLCQSPFFNKYGLFFNFFCVNECIFPFLFPARFARMGGHGFTGCPVVVFLLKIRQPTAKPTHCNINSLIGLKFSSGIPFPFLSALALRKHMFNRLRWFAVSWFKYAKMLTQWISGFTSLWKS